MELGCKGCPRYGVSCVVADQITCRLKTKYIGEKIFMKNNIWNIKNKFLNQKKLVLLIFLVVFLVLSGKASSCCMGQGEITKIVLWEDGTPIEGAGVWIGEPWTMQYTDANGETTFLDCPSGPEKNDVCY